MGPQCPILQLCTPRHRKVQEVALGHTAIAGNSRLHAWAAGGRLDSTSQVGCLESHSLEHRGWGAPAILQGDVGQPTEELPEEGTPQRRKWRSGTKMHLGSPEKRCFSEIQGISFWNFHPGSTSGLRKLSVAGYVHGELNHSWS